MLTYHCHSFKFQRSTLLLYKPSGGCHFILFLRSQNGKMWDIEHCQESVRRDDERCVSQNLKHSLHQRDHQINVFLARKCFRLFQGSTEEDVFHSSIVDGNICLLVFVIQLSFFKWNRDVCISQLLVQPLCSLFAFTLAIHIFVQFLHDAAQNSIRL